MNSLVGSVRLLGLCLLCGCATGRDPRIATIDTPASSQKPQAETRSSDRGIVPAGHLNENAPTTADAADIESRWAPWLAKLKPAPRVPLPVNATRPGDPAEDSVSRTLSDVEL